MPTLFIRGINDSNTASLIRGNNGGVHFTYDGCCGVYWFMKFDPGTVAEVTLFGGKINNQEIRLKEKPSLVFNEISDPDSHHGALKRCEILCHELQCPTINHPSSILQTTRDSVSRLLQGIPGVRMPVTVRLQPQSPEDIFTKIEEAGLALPVIVRLAGSHGGTSCTLITGRSNFDKLHVYPFDGSAFYLTEFVDYAGDDGYYRKLRIAVIDGVPLYRHHLIGDKWMVHASSQDFLLNNDALLEETRTFNLSFDEQILPMIKPAIDEISRRLQLEYYGIDFNIDKQGKLLIFEANANMNILFNDYEPLDERLDTIRQHIVALLDKSTAKGSQQKISRNS